MRYFVHRSFPYRGWKYTEYEVACFCGVAFVTVHAMPADQPTRVVPGLPRLGSELTSILPASHVSVKAYPSVSTIPADPCRAA